MLPATSSRIAERIRQRFFESAGAFQRAASSDYPAALEQAAESMIEAFKAGRKLLAFGNGGSASDAQHLCGELVVRFERERRALPAIALCSDPAVLTACGNDYCYAEIFARQIEALGLPGDIAVAISTSGKSENVVRALQVARERKLRTILFTGLQSSPACAYADIILAAPADTTARIQELHLASYHAICEMVDGQFAQNAG